MLKRSLVTTFDSLMSYVEHINRLNGGTACSLFVIQNDCVVAEYYAGKHSSDDLACSTSQRSQFNVGSVRKSYIGFATAWAHFTGAIKSFDDSVLRYLSASPEESEILKRVTIRNLLTHTHGLSLDKSGQLINTFEPGTDWNYNNVGINLLTEIIPNVLGCSISDLLNEKVFRPLGWKETSWCTTFSDLLVPVVDDLGTSLLIDRNSDGSRGNLFVTTRELAYWGYLHLKQGEINGESIVPQQILRNATSIQTPARLSSTLPQNGCLWLVKNGDSDQSLIGNDVPNDSYGIVGITGAVLLVVPELDLVVVRLTNKLGNYEDEQGSYIKYLKDFSNKAVNLARKNTTTS